MSEGNQIPLSQRNIFSLLHGSVGLVLSNDTILVSQNDRILELYYSENLKKLAYSRTVKDKKT